MSHLFVNDRAIIIKSVINSNNHKPSPTNISINKYWLLGFIEGKGSFGIKNIVPYFQLPQHMKCEYLLDEITKFLYNIVDVRYQFKISKSLHKRTSVLVI